MKFKVKDLNISGGGFDIVVVNEIVASTLDIHVSSRLRLTDDKVSVVAVVDLAESSVIKPGEIGLFSEVYEKLGVKEGGLVSVSVVPQPKSVEFIKKKLDGLELNSREINSIIKDITLNHLSQVEMSAFVTACYTRRLTMDEVFYLTKSIVSTGKTINFKDKIILDKHCIGGISGNRTTMIVVPIIAAYGLKIPKTSSRSITSPSGTADTMEVLAPVELSVKKIKKVADKAGGCIVWGGNVNLAAADDKLIIVRHPLALDPPGLMLASIMAKKKAVGSTHVIIDIPLGIGAKTKDLGEAKFLGMQFRELGEKFGINVKSVITDGSKPIGRGIGPVLEARDVLSVLRNDVKAPKDLRKKSLYLAAELLELSGVVHQGEGFRIVRDILSSGRAYKVMRRIIKLQGGDPDVSIDSLKPGKYEFTLNSPRTGLIKFLSDDLVSRIARAAGAPVSKKAGIYLYRNAGDYVKRGQPVLTIHSESEDSLENAKELITKDLYTIA